MLDNIKIMLGDAAQNFTEEQMTLALTMAEAEVKAITNRTTLDAELIIVVQKIAKITLLKSGTEGLQSQSFGGNSETYLDGYPADIQAVLTRKRKIKVI